jgi:hypothetical protein
MDSYDPYIQNWIKEYGCASYKENDPVIKFNPTPLCNNMCVHFIVCRGCVYENEYEKTGECKGYKMKAYFKNGRIPR